jgi:hypothetical protein
VLLALIRSTARFSLVNLLLLYVYPLTAIVDLQGFHTLEVISMAESSHELVLLVAGRPYSAGIMGDDGWCE